MIGYSPLSPVALPDADRATAPLGVLHNAASPVHTISHARVYYQNATNTESIAQAARNSRLNAIRERFATLRLRGVPSAGKSVDSG